MKRIKLTREQRKIKRYQKFIAEILEALFEHDDDRYYDYLLKLRTIEDRGTGKRVGPNHHGEDGRAANVKVYKFIGGE